MTAKRKQYESKAPSALALRLSALEQEVGRRGIVLHYDRLEAAGLRLKGGLCRIRGEYHLFLERRSTTLERVQFLEEFLDRPLPDDVPEAPF